MVNIGGARMIEVGMTLPEKVFYIDRALLKAYADASGDQNPIHQNEAFALSVGLPNVISHGMLTMALFILVNRVLIPTCICICLKQSAINIENLF